MMLTQEDLCLRMNKYVLKSWNERKENELRAHLLVLRVETGNASQGKTLTLKEFAAENTRRHPGHQMYLVPPLALRHDCGLRIADAGLHPRL